MRVVAAGSAGVDVSCGSASVFETDFGVIDPIRAGRGDIYYSHPSEVERLLKILYERKVSIGGC